MKLDEARRLVQSYAASKALRGSLNMRGFGALIDVANLAFEYRRDLHALKCSALIYRFHGPPKEGVLEAIRAHAASSPQVPGDGLVLEFEPENDGLFISLVCADSCPHAFGAQMERLVAQARYWTSEGLMAAVAR